VSDSYKTLGASASKAGLHQALTQAGLAAGEDLFAPVCADVAGDPAYSCFLHADGAGTKTIVSYLRYRETGDPQVFAGLAQDALVMNLDDVFCIGTPSSLLLSNAISRNARLIGDDALTVLLSAYKELQRRFAALGIPIELAGGETADCGDVVRTLVVDAVLFGRIRTERLIRASRISAGDVIVGLSSTGQATYEDTPNSGIASNGLTLARHCLLSKAATAAYPEVLDPNLDPNVAYRGPFGVQDSADGLSMSVGEALSSPTRSYAPVLAAVYAQLPDSIHAAIHLTGGAQTKVLRFGRGLRIVKDQLFPVPPLFSLIRQHGQVPWREMYQVFNMGHRLELYLPPSAAERAIAVAGKFGIEGRIIGHVEAHGDPAANLVCLRTEQGEFEYSR
jgi:phosphoribosylformylglycinamidine cyclo-ligase